MIDLTKSHFDREYINSLNHETPFFIFSKDMIRNKYKAFKEHFPGADVHYAMKANSEQEILDILRIEDAGFEVASIYELKMLKKIGVSSEKIIYGTSVKSSAHIKEFYDYGVRIFAFDSQAELQKIAYTAPESKVYVRIAVNDTGSVFKFSEKFGTEIENILPMLKSASELGLIPYGISFHVGSQASNLFAWGQGLERISKVLESLELSDIKIKMINIGGGFPCNYVSAENDLELKEIADNTYKYYKDLPFQPRLALEPGRGIIAEAGILVATVIERIERRGSTWLFLDAGVYNALYETMAYQGSTRYKIESLRESYNSGEKLFSLAGPTGDAPDVLTKEALLPQDMAVGDKLIFHNVGAYSLSAYNGFNGFPKPKVYYI